MPRLARKCSGCRKTPVDINEFESQNSLCNNCIERFKQKRKKMKVDIQARSRYLKYYKTRYDKDKNKLETIVGKMVSGAKRRAKKYNLLFNINVKYIMSIYP
ncbi:MAG TPA: hypothetical protein VMX17_03255, partial [Candidatus Glassbacteria bacterium]|nr:hypothetical protein [Candidatus Glassbacteria bacterium]